MTISISNLRKSYDAKVAVADLSLQVESGEILGFLGPNGAGKSTTVKVLTGLLTPDAGSASICGFDVVKEPIEAKQRFGYIPEAPAMYETLTAAEYLDLDRVALPPRSAHARGQRLRAARTVRHRRRAP